MATNAPTKKMIDSWKTKQWYNVLAPKFLNEIEIAQVPALDEEHLMNRVLVIPLKEITRDLSHMYTNIKLRVCEIRGKTALTKFIGHEVNKEYIATLVRRRRDILNVVFPVKSKDDLEFKVKVVIVTNGICSETQKRSLRALLEEELTKKVKTMDFGEFIMEVLYGKTSAEMFAKLKKITPLRRVEIRKTELEEDFDTEEETGAVASN